MWRLKLKVDSSKQPLGSFAVKQKVSIAGNVLSTYKYGKNLYLIGTGFIFGEEKNKKAFMRGLKRQKWLVNFEFKDDFGLLIMKQPLYTQHFWNPKVIQLSPAVINYKEKQHLWDLASFDRKALEKVLEFAEKYLGAKVLRFREEKISNVSFVRLLPELTKNQKKALELAINYGYYAYPKKIKMEKLAKLMGISYSTYQAHLKKAEGKILPEVYKEL